MTATLLDQGWRAAGIISCFDQANNIYYQLKEPNSLPTLPTGIVKELVTSVVDGIDRNIDAYFSEEKPTLTLTFPNSAGPGLMSLKTGYVFDTGTGNTSLNRRVVVPADGIVPAAGPGIEGNGLPADAPAVCLPVLNGLNGTEDDALFGPALTQVNVAPADNTEFQVLADGSVVVDTSYAGQQIEFYISGSVTGEVVRTETRVGNLTLIIPLYTSQNRPVILTIDDAQALHDGNAVSPDDEVEVNFVLFNAAGECSAYQITYLDDELARAASCG